MHIKFCCSLTWTKSLCFLGLLVARQPQGLGLCLRLDLALDWSWGPPWLRL